MTKKSTLHRIAPDQLPDLLTRLDDGQTTELALMGWNIGLSESPDDWPEELQGRVVFQLNGKLSGRSPSTSASSNRSNWATTKWARLAPERSLSSSASSHR
jgi:hypothetical protein